MADFAIHAVGLREHRHGLGRPNRFEDEGNRNDAADDDDRRPHGPPDRPLHGLTSMVRTMSPCPAPHTMLQCTLYVPAFFGVTSTSTNLPGAIVVAGIPRSSD